MPSNVAEPRSRPTRARGFTLIEVLAALVIVALGMLGVIQAVTQTARNGTYLREKTLAHWIAMNLITERRLLPTPPDVAESKDEVEFAGQRWRWTMKVTQTEVDSMRRMDVSVGPADAPEGRALATLTGFYGTAIGQSGGGTLAWSGTPGGGGPGDGDGDGDGAGGDGDGDGTGAGGDGQGTPPVTGPSPTPPVEPGPTPPPDPAEE
jgi:general secretion pathway protein I